MLKIARCTVDWRSIRDLNSGGATNALSHFECDPFDLLGNAPYVNLQKSFPEKGEKSRREQQILSCRKCADFNDNTMENQEGFPKCRLDFECCRLCIPSTNLVELGGSSWKFLFPFPRQILTHFPPKMEVQRPYLNPTQFFRFCSKNTPFLPEGKN